MHWSCCFCFLTHRPFLFCSWLFDDEARRLAKGHNKWSVSERFSFYTSVKWRIIKAAQYTQSLDTATKVIAIFIYVFPIKARLNHTSLNFLANFLSFGDFFWGVWFFFFLWQHAHDCGQSKELSYKILICQICWSKIYQIIQNLRISTQLSLCHRNVLIPALQLKWWH